MSERTPESEWEWCGFAGHFVGADSCRFRLNTKIGEHRVSTIGAMPLPDGSGWTTFGVTLTGDAFFETMIWRLGEPTEAEPHGSMLQPEVAREFAATAEAAEAMHMRWCKLVAQYEIRFLPRDELENWRNHD